MKKYYHMTSLDKVRSISNVGLTPNGEENKLVKESKDKLTFSEGMTGVVAKFANYQKHYDLIKSGVVGGIDPDIVEKVNKTNSMAEYLKDEVFITFDGEEIENEKNFMLGETDKNVDSDKLNVCILKNGETGEVEYLNVNVVHYMMAKVPVESINYVGNDLSEDKVEKKIQDIRQDVSNYIKKHEKEINTYKYGNYVLENIPVKSFCSQYLFQKGDNITGQALGKATMDLLKDVNAVREMEAQLDRDVRELTQERETTNEEPTLIPQERAERKKESN